MLFYTYGDAQKARHMIKSSAEENNTAPEVVNSNIEALNAMVSRTDVLLVRGVICDDALTLFGPHSNVIRVRLLSSM